MKRAKQILLRALYPPMWVIAVTSAVGFGGVIPVFALSANDSPAAYIIYCTSAYALTVLSVSAPKIYRTVRYGVKNSRAARRIRSTRLGGKYLEDMSFRGSVGLYQGMAANFLYVAFRIVAGVQYTSIWFISMAAYYLALGALRAYLVHSRRRKRSGALVYRRTAWLLFLLNIPMGGMILQMVVKNSGYSYPGYMIYLSAMYTFYTAILAAVNIVKFRRLGDPLLSAAKVLNLVAAMMSVLGLQTAMIAHFSSDGEGFRRRMNMITGGAVYGGVIAIAVYMLRHSYKLQEKEELS